MTHMRLVILFLEPGGGLGGGTAEDSGESGDALTTRSLLRWVQCNALTVELV